MHACTLLFFCSSNKIVNSPPDPIILVINYCIVYRESLFFCPRIIQYYSVYTNEVYSTTRWTHDVCGSINVPHVMASSLVALYSSSSTLSWSPLSTAVPSVAKFWTNEINGATFASAQWWSCCCCRLQLMFMESTLGRVFSLSTVRYNTGAKAQDENNKTYSKQARPAPLFNTKRPLNPIIEQVGITF